MGSSESHKIIWIMFCIFAAAVVLSCIIPFDRYNYEIFPSTDASTTLPTVIVTEKGEYIYLDSSGNVISSSDYYSSKPTGYMSVTVNINTASAKELSDVLPGIGKVKAEAIVEYREAIGGYHSVDELLEVDGIGAATLDNIRPFCVIE